MVLDLRGDFLDSAKLVPDGEGTIFLQDIPEVKLHSEGDEDRAGCFLLFLLNVLA